MPTTRVSGIMIDGRNAGFRLPSVTMADLTSQQRQLDQRGVRFITYEDWRVLDAAEISRGAEQGRPRVKFIERDAFFEALGSETASRPIPGKG